MKFHEKTYRKSLLGLSTNELEDALVYEAKWRFENALPKVTIRAEDGIYRVIEAPDNVTVKILDIDIDSHEQLLLRTYRGTTQESVRSFKKIPRKYR